VDPVPDPMLLRKSGSAGNRIQDIWVSSQDLRPLDHRGGLVPVTEPAKCRISTAIEVTSASSTQTNSLVARDSVV
jgi:hypothetical protein